MGLMVQWFQDCLFNCDMTGVLRRDAGRLNTLRLSLFGGLIFGVLGLA